VIQCFGGGINRKTVVRTIPVDGTNAVGNALPTPGTNQTALFSENAKKAET
jgi:hypothetical protein